MNYKVNMESVSGKPSRKINELLIRNSYIFRTNQITACHKMNLIKLTPMLLCSR